MNIIDQNQVDDFHSVRIRLASPETILRWSHGEVTKPETINYRTQRAERDGLFDEKIFGPTKDWECFCGKYKRVRYKGIVCDKCGVEVTKSSVRRERMGHIKLAVPVTHVWFLRGVPSRLGLVLDIGAQDLEKVVYFASYIITSIDEDSRAAAQEQIEKEYKAKLKEIESRYTSLIERSRNDIFQNGKGKDKDAVAAQADTEVQKLKTARDQELSQLSAVRDLAKSELKSIKPLQVLSELHYRDLSLKFGQVFTAGIGSEAVKHLLEQIDLEKLAQDLSAQAKTTEGQAVKRVLKRLKLVKSLINAGIRPEWMLVIVLPVIPPDLRPMVQLDGGRFATSDLNDLYRRVINRNNRLKKLIEIKSPEVIVRNEKRMLQEAVDALIDNSIRHGKETQAATGQKRKLRSLADLLKGKQGRFRQNLLGKRVDYSGRSVIVVGPELKLNQCGLPKKMALELFKPFVISKLITREYAFNVRSATRLIEQGRSEVYDILEEVIQNHYVLLNRAPTLHRLSFQAFQPVLIEGKAIQLHPMVCAAFNADFDGDQMAVHVPLTLAAQKEAREMMVATHNLLKPASGEPVMIPDKDVVVGCFYLTSQRPLPESGKKKYFSDFQEALLALSSGIIGLQDTIAVRKPNTTELIDTSAGKILFNQLIPEQLGYRNDTFDKKKLQALVREVYRLLGSEGAANFVDLVKKLGFRWMMNSGVSWGMADLIVPTEKSELVEKADEQVELAMEQFQEGLLTEEERYGRTIEIWTGVADKISKSVTQTVKDFSSVYYIVKSGGRGSAAQLMQMAGLKGLVVSPSGATIELPCRSGFKEGLSVLEYFISTHGSRKGMSDTALKTADAGYLTRRLVDVAQDIVINSEDCGSVMGVEITRAESEKINTAFEHRLFGRVAAIDAKDKEGNVVVKAGEAIDEDLAKAIAQSTCEGVLCRSALYCKLLRGICKHCYGFDLGFNRMVDLGAAVGIVAAQSIGEPGTQLTMRTFQMGGSASAGDITRGLPRVEELLEARSEPKGEAFLAEFDGTVYVSPTGAKTNLVRIEGINAEKSSFILPEGVRLEKEDGSRIGEGETLFVQKSGEAVVADRAGFVRVHGNEVFVVSDATDVQEVEVPSVIQMSVKSGDLVVRGQALTEGSLSPTKLMHLRGTEAAQEYIVREVITIYASQGQQISEKHIELIVRQMFSKVRVQDQGDTQFVSGDMADKARLRELNEQLESQGLRPATYEQLLMGITKVSLSTDSWMAAASFQNTTQVLIEAAITGRVDYLKGLKENVIIGKLIPAGTGFRKDAVTASGLPSEADVTALELSLVAEND